MSETHSLEQPATVTWLGYGGLIPFLTLAAANVLNPEHGVLWHQALYAYGAIILAFVGALHWGLAMSLPGLSRQRRTACFVWSVIPALVAWPALLAPAASAAPVLIIGFIAHFLQDRRLAGEATLPAWYLPLRLRLTSVAVLCLASGFATTIA